MLCLVLFFCELTAFLTAKPTTDVVMDSNQDQMLQINFDVQMYDMSCDHVSVGVWDSFGTDRLNITRNIQKQRMDHTGNDKGKAYTDEELVELEFADKNYTGEEMAELESDWSSTSDSFKHNDFLAVVESHDFTFINFYADWCPHCRHFAPTWAQFEKTVNEEKKNDWIDADKRKVSVRALKINCVDFEEECQAQSIHAFPSLRLYRRSTAQHPQFEAYEGGRDVASLVKWMTNYMSKRHSKTGVKFHQIFREGCRLSGSVDVARVPGTLHFEARHSAEKTLNFAFTNVSHYIHHFSFGTGKVTANRLPREYRKQVAPLDTKSFIVTRFHQAPHHFIKVVSTRFDQLGIRSYQMTHQSNTRTVARHAVPQASFSYDLSPVEVVVSKTNRRWYDFVTSVFAIVGGTFSVMSITSGVCNVASKAFKNTINKLS